MYVPGESSRLQPRQPRLQPTELLDLPLQQAPECLNHHRHLLPHRLISMLPELTLTTFRSDFMHPAGCKTNIAPKLRYFCNFGAIFFRDIKGIEEIGCVAPKVPSSTQKGQPKLTFLCGRRQHKLLTARNTIETKTYTIQVIIRHILFHSGFTNLR